MQGVPDGVNPALPPRRPMSQLRTHPRQQAQEDAQGRPYGGTAGLPRMEGRAGRCPAVAVPFDEMWIYRGARRREKREDWRSGT